MPGFAIREEVLNVLLAELLSNRGLLSVPESIRRSVANRRQLPDVTVADLMGVRIVIEGRIGQTDDVLVSLVRDGKERVESGLSPICLTVAYPTDLRNTRGLDASRRALDGARLLVRVISEGDDGDWTESDLDGLADILRRSYELLVNEDVVIRTVEELEYVIEQVSERIRTSAPGSVDRIRDALGIPEPDADEDQQDNNAKITRVAGLTLVNAMIFQQVLSHRESTVPPLARVIAGDDVGQGFNSAWQVVLAIDYAPIFQTAYSVLLELLGVPDVDLMLKDLAETGMHITGRRAALRHDLMGRIYHRLLLDAKFFGAFYTTVPAAGLLLKLTLSPPCLTRDWTDVNGIGQLRIADFACGTGTLLKAALQTIVDNYVRSRSEAHHPVQVSTVHKTIIENVLWGMDVVPFAIHLAGSALSIHEPDVAFDRMWLYTMQLGRRAAQSRLGSLDFLYSRRQFIQAGLYDTQVQATRIAGQGGSGQVVEIPDFDLVVMNPPFTRSVGGNLLFGNLPEGSRAALQTALKDLVRRRNIRANITAGLGSVFAALGDQYLKAGGVMSLVLPRALLTGVSWEDTRRLIGEKYDLKYIIVSQEPGHWNFSENTSLSECMIVARKLQPGEQRTGAQVVNLSSKPRTSIEALTLAQVIRETEGVPLVASNGVQIISSGQRRYGELLRCPPDKVVAGQWGDEIAFAQTELCRAAVHVRTGTVYVPGIGQIGQVPIIRLGDLGDIGPDRRDIHDGFSVVTNVTPYPAFWGHQTDSVRRFSVDANKYLSPLARAPRGRHLRDPHLLWSRSGRVLVAERLRLNNVRILAARSPESVLSNTWWPLALDYAGHSEAAEKALVLWFNGTLGILSLIAARVDTEGAWVELKKPIVKELLVLDPRRLTTQALDNIAATFDQIAALELAALPGIAQDQTRRMIDEAILSALGITGDLESIRRMLAEEPVLAQ